MTVWDDLCSLPLTSSFSLICKSLSRKYLHAFLLLLALPPWKHFSKRNWRGKHLKKNFCIYIIPEFQADSIFIPSLSHKFLLVVHDPAFSTSEYVPTVWQDSDKWPLLWIHAVLICAYHNFRSMENFNSLFLLCSVTKIWFWGGTLENFPNIFSSAWHLPAGVQLVISSP